MCLNEISNIVPAQRGVTGGGDLRFNYSQPRSSSCAEASRGDSYSLNAALISVIEKCRSTRL